MESRGIPVFCQDNIPTIRNPTRGAVFVCINAQYEDAVALLANEDHEVRQPVDIEEFKTAVSAIGLPAVLKGALIVLGVEESYGGHSREDLDPLAADVFAVANFP